MSVCKTRRGGAHWSVLIGDYSWVDGGIVHASFFLASFFAFCSLGGFNSYLDVACVLAVCDITNFPVNPIFDAHHLSDKNR